MTDDKLMQDLKLAAAAFKKLSDEEQKWQFLAQVKSVAKVKTSWLKAKFHWENGVKVYESYEDYCND